MDNDGIPIWIGDDRHVADGCLQRLKPEQAKAVIRKPWWSPHEGSPP